MQIKLILRMIGEMDKSVPFHYQRCYMLWVIRACECWYKFSLAWWENQINPPIYFFLFVINSQVRSLLVSHNSNIIRAKNASKQQQKIVKN